MATAKFTTSIVPGAKANEAWYVAVKEDGEEIAKVRIPSHLLYIEDEERKAFLFRQVAAALAKKLHSLGYKVEK